MRWLLLVLMLTAFGGCTTIPPESVKLSTMLGHMIINAKVAHINLVNKHFDRLVDDTDRFMLGEYKVAFLNNLRKTLKRDDPNFQELTMDQYDKAMDRLMKIRLNWVNDIQKARRDLLASLEEYYAVMAQANNEVTNLLGTATGLGDSRNKILDAFGGQVSTKARELETKLFDSTNYVEQMLRDQLRSITN